VLAGLGLTLLLSSRVGRPGLLLPATIVAGVVTMAMMGSPAIGRFADVSDYSRTVTTMSDLPQEVGVTAGDVTLDLSGLQLTADRNLTITVNAGSVDLKLPQGAASDVDWTISAGRFNADGVTRDGIDLSGENTYPATTPGAPTLHVAIEVDLGEVQVHR
jgi:hypothetical protein